MDYELRQKIEKTAKNKYEAVIVAAKLARQINMNRLASEENLGPEAPPPTYAHKVTTEAINKLAEGNIQYRFREATADEEEVYPE